MLVFLILEEALTLDATPRYDCAGAAASVNFAGDAVLSVVKVFLGLLTDAGFLTGSLLDFNDKCAIRR